MNTAELRSELEQARKEKKYVACFMSICTRNATVLEQMDTDERKQFIKAIGAKESYITTLTDVLAVFHYDKENRNDY